MHKQYYFTKPQQKSITQLNILAKNKSLKVSVLFMTSLVVLGLFKNSPLQM